MSIRGLAILEEQEEKEVPIDAKDTLPPIAYARSRTKILSGDRESYFDPLTFWSAGLTTGRESIESFLLKRERPRRSTLSTQNTLHGKALILEKLVSQSPSKDNDFTTETKSKLSSDAATSIDQSMIFSVAELEASIEEIEDDLELTKEMMLRNQETHLKSAVLDFYNRLHSRIKKIEMNYNMALVEERLCKKQDLQLSLQELQNQHEDFLECKLKAYKKSLALDLHRQQKQHDLVSHTLSKSVQELERSELKTQKLKQIMIRLRLDDRLSSDNPVFDFVQYYQELNDKKCKEIDEMKIKLALLHAVNEVDTAKQENINQIPAEVNDATSEEVNDQPRKDQVAPQNEINAPQSDDTQEIKEEEVFLNPFQNSLNQIKSQQNQELAKIRLYRETMCKKWKKKILVATKLQNSGGLKESLALQQRLLSFAILISKNGP